MIDILKKIEREQILDLIKGLYSIRRSSIITSYSPCEESLIQLL